MKGFTPREVLFSPTADCPLDCDHCSVVRDHRRLPADAAVRFLESCRGAGIERVGFTGGEPFLETDFLFRVAEAAVRLGFLFDRITTSGAWYRNAPALRRILSELRDRGYDGSFAVSVDAFHGPNPAKAARFISAAADIWNRPDIARVVAARGARDRDTTAVLQKLASALDGRLTVKNGRRIVLAEGLILPVTEIDLVPVGKAEGLVNPWTSAWFREDHCRGPGHVFYVLPDGSVKPCCGYATEAEALTIGNIHTDTAAALLRSAARNPFVRAVFENGLTRIRRALAREGVVFPGSTGNHCYFCHHILSRVPPPALKAALAGQGPAPERPLRRGG